MTARRRGVWIAGCLLLAGCGGDERGVGAEGDPASERIGTAQGEFAREFVDITQAAGVDFIHVTGAFGEKYLPETLGSGCAFLDYDGDGRLDLFLVGARYWPGHPPPGGERDPGSRLYRGLGERRFEDVSGATGAGVSRYGMGCAIADYDDDGDPDIYLTALDGNVLLRNDGGRFRDVTANAGVGGGTWRDRDGGEHPEWSTAAAWADLDGDDDLDLFVANYVRWTVETDIFTSMDGVRKAFTTPDRYSGLPCRFYRNRGDGTFEDASAAAGLLGLEGKALGVALWDFDGNGGIDIAVANDTRPNFLLSNRGDGVFEERGLALGVAYDEDGRARAGMGIDIADFANDGSPAIAIGNFSREPMSLYRWQPSGGFASHAARAGLAGPTFAPLTFGVGFFDFDLDGCLDLAIANGHIEPEIASFQPGERHAQPAQLLWCRPGGRFEDASAAAGTDFSRPRVGRGLAGGDLDGDGDIDLLLTENGGRAVLLENRTRAGGASGRHLRVRLAQPGRNRDALGAQVLLCAGGVTQRRLVRTGSSYLSQSELVLTFGLGSAERVDELQVVWPDGYVTMHQVHRLDTTITIARGGER